MNDKKCTLRFNARSRLALLALLMSGLIACSSSSQQIRYYTLDNSVQRQAVSSSQVIHLEPINLAGYLQDKSLLILSSNQQVVFSAYHHWAEPLQDNLYRVLSSDLEAETNMAVLQKSEAMDACSSIVLRVENFAPNDAGIVEFTGRWFINSGGVLQSSENFSYKQSMQSDGFVESTAILRALVKRLATDIGAVIQRQPSCRG